MGMVLDQTGRYLFITNNGQGVQSLVVFDTLAGGIVEKKPYPTPEALFSGSLFPRTTLASTPRPVATTKSGFTPSSLQG